MSTLSELKNLLIQPTRTVGVIVSVDPTSVTVASRQGTSVVAVSSLNRYVKGEEVVMSSGAIVGKVRKEEGLPVYFV